MGTKVVSLSLVGLISLVIVLPYAAFVNVNHHASSGPEHSAPISLLVAESAPSSSSPSDLLRVITEAREALSRARQLEATRPLLAPTPPRRDASIPLAGGTGGAVKLGQSSTGSVPTLRGSSFDLASPAARSPAAHPRGDGVDLVIGLGTGITPENLAVFAGSLRDVNPNCALVLYLDAPLPKLHSDIVARFNVTSIEFSVKLLDPAFLRKYHPSNYRWPLLYRYMREHVGMYRKILMADVRDTYYQGDPFSSFERGFFAFNGVESRTIGECGWNGGWIRDCFGATMVSKLSKNTIICSGISMGSVNEVTEYLKLMSETMEADTFAKCERNGVDQGVHNVLVHTKKIPMLKILTQKAGWVANMQAGLAVITKKGVHNQNGDRVTVVHQYDRFKDLQAGLFKRYVFWPMPSEAETCADFTLAKETELFKKTCDLKVTSGHSTSHCCIACQRMDGCKAFSFAGSQCFLKKCTGPRKKISMPGVTSGYLTNG